MSATTGIEWCDSTFNPWMGCTKVSPACDHCYAERDTKRFGRVEWGAGKARVRTTSVWNYPARWNKAAFVQCPACSWRGDWAEADRRGGCCPECNHLPERFINARRRVFCASLADWLDNEVSIEWLVDLLDLIRRTPNLDWLLLTKRIGNWQKRIEDARIYLRQHQDTQFAPELHDWMGDWQAGDAPANVWIGSTVINQAEADRDVPKLLAVPAAVRFLSIEPMLGPVDLRHWIGTRPAIGASTYNDGTVYRCDLTGTPVDGIHWIIAGGESGQHARPAHPDWYRSLRDQCAAAGVPFLFKQWGELAPMSRTDGFHELPFGDYLPHAKPPFGYLRVGKKMAGRQLDGRTHDGFPEPAHA